MFGLGIRVITDELFDRLVSKLRKNAKFVTPEGKEICVLCHEVTDVDFATPIGQRQHYVEGCGQHCEKCCRERNLCGQRDLAV